jgi:hypothetical protein
MLFDASTSIVWMLLVTRLGRSQTYIMIGIEMSGILWQECSAVSLHSTRQMLLSIGHSEYTPISANSRLVILSASYNIRFIEKIRKPLASRAGGWSMRAPITDRKNLLQRCHCSYLIRYLLVSRCQSHFLFPFGYVCRYLQLINFNYCRQLWCMGLEPSLTTFHPYLQLRDLIDRAKA